MNSNKIGVFLVAPEFNKSEPLVTGLEWEDPEHVNRISATEHRKLCLVLTQIAVLINKRRLVLRPYFQDYELVCVKNNLLPKNLSIHFSIL